MNTATLHAPPIPPLRQRARTAMGAIRKISKDPNRLDQVLVLVQAVNARTISDAVVKFGATEEGRRFFEERPRIDRTHVDFDALRKLPAGTLGREYTRFLDDNGITPDVFEALPDVGDERAALLMLRMRQTHDLWHVLTGYKPDLRGELLLQAFTYAQVRAPSALVLLAVGTLRGIKFGMRANLRYFEDLRRAFQRGEATSFLPTVRWEAFWTTPLSDLRLMLECPSDEPS